MTDDGPKRRSEHQDRRAALLAQALDLVADAWAGWLDDNGDPYPVPDDWADTVRMFVRLGIPPHALGLAVEQAMLSDALDPWRYWCGIGWRRIRRREKRS
jgi:hypothetical protein